MLKAFVLSLLVGVTVALVPNLSTRPAVQGRREVLEQAAGVLGAVLIAPKPAFADGAVSPATVQRARGIYGSRIASLKGAVENGDFDAILEEKNAFELFNSGAFSLRSATAKEQKKTSVAATKDILEACAAKDKSKLKSVAESAYTTFMKNAAIDISPVDVATGQGYQSEFDWKARTPKGSIYQR